MIRHIITGEFPPDLGGVAGYTDTVARALAAAGEEVHVWCPGGEGTSNPVHGLFVHRVMGELRGRDFARVDRALHEFPAPRRLLVQWVPHAYGRSSLNLAFCRWIRRRARRSGDQLEVMIHEPFLPLAGGLRQRGAALVHRWMLKTLLSGAVRVFVATGTWAARCRPYAPRVPRTWLPIPSGIAVTASAADARAIRSRLGIAPDHILVGAVGRAGTVEQLCAVALALVAAPSPASMLLIGAGTTDKRALMLCRHPELSTVVHATGSLAAEDVSRHLRACDVILQLYPDGVSGRRSGAMSALAHGVPLITMQGEATESVWRPDAVLLLPAGTSPAAAVCALLENPGERARLAAAGLALYDRHFSLRHTVAALRS